MQLSEIVKKIEQELEEAKSSAKEKQLLYENSVSAVSVLEKSIKEHDNNREGRLKDLEKKIKAIKVQIQSASKDLKVGFDTTVLTMRLPIISFASSLVFLLICLDSVRYFALYQKVSFPTPVMWALFSAPIYRYSLNQSGTNECLLHFDHTIGPYLVLS